MILSARNGVAKDLLFWDMMACQWASNLQHFKGSRLYLHIQAVKE